MPTLARCNTLTGYQPGTLGLEIRVSSVKLLPHLLEEVAHLYALDDDNFEQIDPQNFIPRKTS